MPFAEELGTWLTSNRDSISLFVRRVKHFRYFFVLANTSRGARIIRQRSDADCVFQRSWGYDHSRVWVDRGCRADFEIGFAR